MEDIDRINSFVVDFNRSIVDFSYGLNLQMISKTCRATFTDQIPIKILGNVLRVMLSVLPLNYSNKEVKENIRLPSNLSLVSG